MDVKNKELSWLEVALFLLSIGFGIYGVYNILYDVLETMQYLLLASLSIALLLCCDQETLKYFSKLELIRIALFKNVILFVILILGVFYNLGVDNYRLAVKFFSAMFFYFVLMLLTNTFEDNGIFCAIGSMLLFIMVLCLFSGWAALLPFVFLLP